MDLHFFKGTQSGETTQTSSADLLFSRDTARCENKQTSSADLPFLRNTFWAKQPNIQCGVTFFYGTQSGETSRTSSADLPFSRDTAWENNRTSSMDLPFRGTQSGKTTEHPVRTYLFYGTQSGHTWADVAVTARPYTGLAGNVYPKERCPGLQHNISLHLSRTKSSNNDNVYWVWKVTLLLHLLCRVELPCYYIFYAESRIANFIEGEWGGGGGGGGHRE